MKKLLFAGIAVSMLAACSQDEVVPVNNDSNAIKFAATTQNGTRAADVFCNAHQFDKFNVYALLDGTTLYIQNDEIAKPEGSSVWQNNTGLRYWPNSGSLRFYGYVNGELNTETAAAPTFKDFKVEGYDNGMKSQVDLMYAVKEQSKDDGTQVNLNFRHALSQIVFQAKNENANLKVEISEVAVVKVSDQGTYHLPTEGNTDIYTDAHPNDPTEDAVRGEWDNLSPANKEYRVKLDKATSIVGKVNLTNWNEKENTEVNGYKLGTDKLKAMMLIPQTNEAVDPKKSFEGQTGSYFLVNCRIWNVADGVETPLWGADVAKDVLIPVALDWKEGKKYIYTFVFGNGNGGYNPDPDDPTPDPVLVPITFEVSVDEFVEVDKGDYETGVE